MQQSLIHTWETHRIGKAKQCRYFIVLWQWSDIKRQLSAPIYKTGIISIPRVKCFWPKFDKLSGNNRTFFSVLLKCAIYLIYLCEVELFQISSTTCLHLFNDVLSVKRHRLFFWKVYLYKSYMNWTTSFPFSKYQS